MFPLPPFLAPSALSARALNKLLQREDWARERLARHAGKSVGFVVGSFKANFSIQAGGLVQTSDPAIIPDVTLTVPLAHLSRLPDLLQSRDPDGIAELLHVQGDASLARVVSELARDLRWDLEEDLARVLGDMTALRLVGAGRSASDGLRTAGQRLAGNAAEFLTEESNMMASRPAYSDWSATVQQLASRLDRLESRLSALTAASARRA